MSVKILSFNCRGLGGIDKRRDVLNFLKQKKFSIYLLQDTHFTANDFHLVRSIWGYEILVSPGRSDSRGVAILFNNNFEFKIKTINRDENGNFLIVHFSSMEIDMLLVTVYGPNKDDPDFYHTLKETIPKSIHTSVAL